MSQLGLFDAVSEMQQSECRTCGQLFPVLQRPGRPKLYCSARCRHNALVTIESRVCAQCGNTFAARPYLKNKFCSAACHKLSLRTLNGTTRECRQCGKSFEPKNKTSAFCSVACVGKWSAKNVPRKRMNLDKTCQQCGAACRKKGNTAGLFCSRECAFAYKREHPQFKCKGCGKPTRSTDGDYCSGKCEDAHRTIPCVWCGATFTQRNGARTCSAPCAEAKYQADYKAAWLRKRGPRDYTRDCKICGKTFTPENGRTAGSACPSPSCRRAVKRLAQKGGKAARKARLLEIKGEAYSRIDIFARDGWVCQLCGFDIDPGLKVPDKFAATIDHIVHISRGGADAPGNVRAAHFICNSHRGTTKHGRVRGCAVDPFLVRHAVGC